MFFMDQHTFEREFLRNILSKTHRPLYVDFFEFYRIFFFEVQKASTLNFFSTNQQLFYEKRAKAILRERERERATAIHGSKYVEF